MMIDRSKPMRWSKKTRIGKGPYKGEAREGKLGGEVTDEKKPVAGTRGPAYKMNSISRRL